MTCPCERHGRCKVYRQLLGGEVNAWEYTRHVKAVVAMRLAVRDVAEPPPPAIQKLSRWRAPYVCRDSGSLMVIWAGWAMRIVWDGGRMGYSDRWRWLAPISTRFKLCPYRKDRW